MMLVGGQLLTGLHALGISPTDIDIVVCTHLHSDHCGWLFTPESASVFAAATIWAGKRDIEAVLDGSLESADHIRRGLHRLSVASELVQMDGDAEIAEGIVARPSPGHTLGHYLVEVASEHDRLLIVGDAITCPIQFEEPTWHSFGDMDADLGRSTRDGLWTRMRRESAYAVGCHFPGLREGYLSPGGKRWIERDLQARKGAGEQ
jgi:glyoxylase-like metal-dependent hydrolase (beta-lactamase superfamily II)